MHYLSVCSGIEAASVAWSPLGWQAVAFSEIDKFPCAVLEHRYPDVPNLGDMRRFNEWDISAVDVLVGGTPCQSFSVAGLRGGMADPRGNLALVYLGIADRIRPRWIVWENVPGVLSSGRGRDFGSFVGALGQLGYGWAYRILDAQYCGVAQRRRRVFVVGFLGDWRRAAAVLFERESLRRDTAPCREEREDASGGAARGAGGRRGKGRSGGTDGTGRHAESDGPAVTLRGRPNCSHRADTETFIPVDLRNAACGGDVMGTIEAAQGKGNRGCAVVVAFSSKDRGADAGETCPTIRAAGHDGSHANAGAPPAVAFQEAQTGCREYDTAGSLRANGPGHDPVGTRIRQGWAVRRLTPLEAERLQGFPDGYTLVPYRRGLAADGPRYRAIGNSMAVPIMRWIGERIAAVDTIARLR